MKKFVIIVFVVFFMNATKAQPNLIANPSLEVIAPDTCVAGNLIDILPLFPNALLWFDPNTFNGSTDYFNSCVNNLPFGDTWSAPGPNKWGYQEPRTGNGYVSLQTYWSVQSARGYCSTMLQSKLNQSKYCVRFYVSLGDTCPSYCNTIGAHFSDTVPTVNQMFNFQLSPQIQNDEINNPLGDMLNWTEVRGSFTANGTEKYITLGNFKDNLNSDTVNIVPWGGTINVGYYVDDVSVIELKALHSNDTLVCPQPNFNQTLKAYPGFDSYVWSTGDTTRIINITQAGTYWVTASNWCGTITDTIQVFVFNPFGLDQLLGADKSLCDYQFPQRLRPLPQYENTFTNYQWSTGSDTSFTDVLLPGIYTVTAEHLCGLVTDTITLYLAPNPILNLGNDTTLCIGQQITLNAGNHSTYTWSIQSITPSITINETGIYSVTVTNTFDCIANDNIQVNFVQETAQLLPNDTALYASAFPYTINLSNLYSNYQSNQFPVNSSQLTINTEGTYSLTAIDNYGCIVSDSINIKLKTFELIVPSIISKNQNFTINNLPANSSLHVFDALGQIVYQSNNYQNNFMPLIANAVYFVELAYVANNESEKYIGKLLVVE
jgi:hypothetical protein